MERNEKILRRLYAARYPAKYATIVIFSVLAVLITAQFSGLMYKADTDTYIKLQLLMWFLTIIGLITLNVACIEEYTPLTDEGTVDYIKASDRDKSAIQMEELQDGRLFTGAFSFQWPNNTNVKSEGASWAADTAPQPYPKQQWGAAPMPDKQPLEDVDDDPLPTKPQ